MDAWLGMGGVAAVLVGAVCIVAVLRSQRRLSSEVARKSVHVALGLVVAAFPWIFVEQWPVWPGPRALL